MSDKQIVKEKKTLRKELQEKRNSLSASDYREKNRRIVERLIHSGYYHNSNIIHTYIPIKERREVDIEPLIRKAFDDGKQLVCPKMEFDSNIMYHYEIHSMDELVPNEWGIREPEPGNTVSVEHIDLVLVPMLGGDRSLQRLGYGKGYYDRFLSRVKGYKVGVLFQLGLLPKHTLPTESHDVPLDALVTEEEIVT